MFFFKFINKTCFYVFITSPAGAVAKYCDEYVCVCVCVCVCPRGYFRNHTRELYQIFVHAAYGRGSILLRRRCDTLFTSGFVDDIMFLVYSGPYSAMNFATKDRFRLNLLTYRKVGQNSRA